MKKNILFILTLLIAFSGFTQTDSSSVKKYSLLIPTVWQNRPKLMFKITKFVEANFPQVKDYQLCVDCKPSKLNVQFFISPAQIESVTNISATCDFITRYIFVSYANLYDDNYQIIKRVYLCDTSDVHNYLSRVALSYILFPKEALANQKNNTSISITNEAIENRFYQSNINTFDINQFIQKNINYFSPKENDLWSEVENIILSFKQPVK